MPSRPPPKFLISNLADHFPLTTPEIAMAPEGARPRRYVSKLISNARITRYLEMYHPEFLPEFERITETEALAS
jgi:hypothetical protein